MFGEASKVAYTNKVAEKSKKAAMCKLPEKSNGLWELGIAR
jgi:hypothetical protein